jgi:hypothetical protein
VVRVAGALIAVALVLGAAPAHASAPSARGRGDGDSAFCDAGRAVKELYDAEAGIDMKKPRSVAKVRAVVVDLQAAAPPELRQSFRRLVNFYDLVVSREIVLLGDEPEKYFAASEPAARGAYRIAQALQRRCRISFRG